MKRFAATLHAALIVSLALASAAAAQTPPGGKPPAPCSLPETRNVDSLAGHLAGRVWFTGGFGSYGFREGYWAGGGQ